MNDNYPIGVDNDAPYNDVEIPLKSFNCSVSSSFSKDTSIKTNEYYFERNEDGGSDIVSDVTDWKSEFLEQHYSISNLLDILKGLCEDVLKNPNACNVYRKAFLRKIIRECEGWIEDEFEVIEN